MSLTTLVSEQHEFKGTKAECEMEASIIMQEDKGKVAGCYTISDVPPYLKKKYKTGKDRT